MPKRPLQSIAGKYVNLRLLEESDLPLTRAWRNQDHIRKWFFDPNHIGARQHREWFRQYRERDDDFTFIIEESAGHRAIGQVALYHIDWVNGRAELGRLMIGVAEAADKGLAHEATQLLVDFALTELALSEVYLEVYEQNIRARKIYEQCGFQVVAQNGNIIRMNKHTSRSN